MSTHEETTEEALSRRTALAAGAQIIPEREPEEPDPLHPMEKYARTFGPDKLTTNEAAKELGVSRELARKWAREQRYPGIPRYKAPMGDGKWLYLWTANEIKQVRELRRPRLVADPEAREPDREAS